MANSSNGGNGGIGFLGALGLLFIGLRLAGVIDWPWWLVLSPLWGGLLLCAVAVAAVAFAVAFTVAWDEMRRWKR